MSRPFMTMRLSRAEYWLLDVAVQDCVPIADLANGDAAAELNRADHQCTVRELADGLQRLFADRFISSYKHGGRGHRRFLARSEIEVELRRPKMPPTSDDPIDPGKRHPDEAFYKLTPIGGAAWESFARPDGSLFIKGIGTRIDDGGDPPYPSRGYAICPARRIIERYLELAHHIGHEIDKASLRWDIVSPWKATYWKTLPTAHRVRYKMIYHDVYAENTGWPPVASAVFDLSRAWYRWRS
jgi:hypothetical protein